MRLHGIEDIEDIYDLSPIQEGLLFHSLLSPDAGVYVEQIDLTLRGELDVAAFRRAWQTIVERHTILRTSFHWQEVGKALQAVHRRARPDLERLDWRGLEADEQQRRFAAFALADRVRGFDYTRPPLMRLYLIRLDDQTYRFFWSFTHLLMDGWSFGLAFQELAAIYAAHAQGREPRLAPARPYRDYVAWWKRQDRSGAEAFWRETLKGIDAPAALQVGARPRRPRGPGNGEPSHGVVLDRSLARLLPALTAVAREHGLTLNSVMQGAWMILLGRYLGRDDVVAGSTASQRPHDLAGAETIMGPMFVTIPVRGRMCPDEPVVSWLQTLQAAMASAREHASLTLPELRNLTDLPGNTALFDTDVAFENVPVPALTLHDLEIIEVGYDGRPHYAITLILVPGEGLLPRLVYDRRRFRHADAERVLRHFHATLESIASDPAQALGQLMVLPARERQGLVVWGRGVRAPVPDDGVLGLVAAQVARTPERVAVGDGRGSLSYRELDARAERLAGHLRGLGVGRGALVGVCLDRSVGLVVALLGVLRAGAAYVPVDPGFPAERVRLMLRDARVGVVVSREALAGRLPQVGAALVCLGPDGAVAEGGGGGEVPAGQPGPEPDGEPGPGLGPQADPWVGSGPGLEDLAYVIFTSGSTGRPKGVMVPHRGLVNFLGAMAAEPGLAADAVLAAVTTPSFDIAALELLGPLTVGGRVELVGRQDAGDGERLAARLAETGATVMQATPATWRLLLAAGWQPPAGFRVLCGGEGLPAELARRLLATGAAVWNLYGPTETTVWSTVHRVTGQEGVDPLPLGRPIANTDLAVLDAAGRLVPVGVAGELLIGGAGLAVGYLGRPELTAQRFVQDPGGLAGRWYRTGDLVRWRAGGVLEFLGRADFQVKVRGFRVELGEVEAVLRQHPAVRDAVVVARQDTPGDTRLVGYVAAAVADDRRGVLVAELRQHARELLPDYMVPAHVMVLDALPLTLNRNKVDRAALPPPDGARPQVGALVAPRTPTEARLVDIWREVLGVDRVGVHDNFFDLGGHSLLATRVITRVRAELGVKVPVRALFQQPTIATLAETIPKTAEAAMPTIPAQFRLPQPDGKYAGRYLLPASFGQRRLWFLNELDPDSGRAYVIDGAVRLHGPLDPQLLQQAVDHLVARHETLRTALAVVDGEPVQVVSPRLALPIERVDLSGQADPRAALDRLLAQRLARPFELTQAPLARITLARLGAAEHVVLVGVHHSICDQWSIQVLVGELVACYQALAAGAAPALAELPVQYGDYAAWQRRWLDGQEARAQLDYWTARLQGLPVLDLPTDHPRPPAQRYHGALRGRALPKRLVVAAEQAARQAGATLFMVGLAALQLLLWRYSGQRDFAVGSPVAGRVRPELEGLIGFFVNNLVLRADLDGDPTVAELLARVREGCLDAYAHAEVPFERLVEQLQPTRDLSRTPLVQAGFAIAERVPEAERQPSGLRVLTEEIDPQTAKVDFALLLSADDGDGGGMRANAEYRTDLFEPATIDRMLAHYQLLLEALAGDPQRRISELPPLPEEERALLDTWAKGPEAVLPDACFPDLFERQVEATPDRVALVFGDRELTYRDLNARANRLAHHLRALGTGPETLVAIVADRSVEMVVGLLGVLKAGAAYVPVDPMYPPERVAFMLADSHTPVVLTQEHLAERLSASGGDARVVCLDRDWPEIARRRRGNPRREITHDSLAYVIYTSGSTGIPKGVAVTHRSVVNLHLTRDLGGFQPDTRILQFAPFSFDVSVWEITMALLGGLTLVVPRPQDLAGGVEIVRLINEQRVTVTFLPPSLLAHLSPEHLPTLELLGSGGEDCPAEVAARWGGKVRFLIGYGPTEATVYATVTDEITAGGHPPIGHPIVNTVTRVLDPELRPVPIGVPGELYIGGAGLARGYLNQPEQTAERFVPDPLSGEQHVRLYRTGDLVRYLPDGNLEFLGRGDEQVKVRGFRVEFGEIEGALRSHPRVRDAAAAVREDTPGDKRLVGYVVADGADGDGTAIAREARELAKSRLPGYMVPALVVPVATLPLTPTGKVDRRALPAPPPGAGATAYVPPRSPVERQLSRIVAEALGVPRVGLDDDFFELGGHSLLAAKVHATILDTWKVDLPVRLLFERPTVGALAAAIEADTAGGEAAGDAQPDPRDDVRLDPDIRPSVPWTWRPRPETVLFTGATGFVGAYLLERVLAETSATVHCLVRGDGDDQAQRRLERQLRDLGLWDERWRPRVRVVAGDLAAPRLGLSPETFADLAERVDEIYHAGAVVDFLRPYAMLRAGNVGGTREVLRLAASGRVAALHHISTLAVFGAQAAGHDVLREDELPDAPPAALGAYDQSKWVAEQVVALARERGIPVAVYRPPRVGGDSRSGTWRSHDVVCHLIRACAVTGMVPDAGMAVDIVPVDYLAAAIARLARRREALGRNFHFAAPRKVPLTLLAEALPAGGYPARLAEPGEWYAAVRRHADEEPGGGLGLVLTMFRRQLGQGAAAPAEPEFDCANTAALLGDELRCPEVDAALLGRYVGSLATGGFLPNPADHGRS